MGIEEASLHFDDIELFLMKAGFPFDGDLLSRPSLQLLHARPLLFIEKSGNFRVDLHQDIVSSQFRGGPFDLTENVVTDRGLRFDQSRSFAVGSRFAQDPGDVLPGLVGREGHESEELQDEVDVLWAVGVGDTDGHATSPAAS